MIHNSICQKCGLYQGVKSPCIQGRGDLTAKLLIIGEAPGKTENEQGIPFVGKSGEILQYYLDKTNVKYYISNAVRCRPTLVSEDDQGNTSTKNRTPTAKEIKLCSAKTFQLIDKMKPDVILALGAVPTSQLMNLGLSMETTRGRIYYHPQIQAYIVPTWHPAFLLRDAKGKKDTLVGMQFEEDIKQAITLLNSPKLRRATSNPRSLFDPVDIQSYLEQLQTSSECSLDLETTGLNPRKDRITGRHL